MPSIIQIIIVLFPELLKHFMFGVMAFIILPVLVSIAPGQQGESVRVFYRKVAMALLNGCLLLYTGRGPKLKKSKRDTRYNDEKIMHGKQWRYFDDDAGLMGTLYGYPFGLAHEARNVVVDARLLYYARRYLELRRDNRFKSNGHRTSFVGVDLDGKELVHPQDIVPVVQKSTSPGLTERVENFAEKAESEFDSRPIREGAEMLVFLGATFGMMWLASQAIQSGAGDIGSSLPIMLGWF